MDCVFLFRRSIGESHLRLAFVVESAAEKVYCHGVLLLVETSSPAILISSALAAFQKCFLARKLVFASLHLNMTVLSQATLRFLYFMVLLLSSPSALVVLHALPDSIIARIIPFFKALLGTGIVISTFIRTALRQDSALLVLAAA